MERAAEILGLGFGRNTPGHVGIDRDAETLFNVPMLGINEFDKGKERVEQHSSHGLANADGTQ